MISSLDVFPAFTVTGKRTIGVVAGHEGKRYSASVPFGTSTGRNEAARIPAEKAYEKLPLLEKLIGMEPDYIEADKKVEQADSTPNFSNIGANLSLGVSLAVARAQKDGMLFNIGQPPKRFPIPIVNTIGGGKHGGGTDWQEFLLIPHSARTPAEAYGMVLEGYESASKRLKESGKMIGINREHALITKMDDSETLEFLSGIADETGLKLGADCAASSFFGNGLYSYRSGKRLSAGEQVDYAVGTAKKFGLLYLEDPIQEEDFGSFAEVTRKLPSALVTGDDIYCTNPSLLAKGIKIKSSRAIIIKPDQIGNVSKTEQVVMLARKSGMVIVPSHRSNETDDSWLADLAMAFGAEYIKIGVGYDVSKHNRLMEIFSAFEGK